jgi:DNA-binding transcriptional MerR regulator
MQFESSEASSSDRLFFKIGEAAELLQVKAYVLRFWETEFPMLTPEKRDNGQRVYRRTDVELLFLIQSLLYEEKYSIEGARNKLREFRRTGELKVRRTKAAQKRGFGLAVAGAMGAGRPVPREVIQIAVNESASLPVAETTLDSAPSTTTSPFELEIGQLISDIKNLQMTLKRSPRSTA